MARRTPASLPLPFPVSSEPARTAGAARRPDRPSRPARRPLRDPGERILGYLEDRDGRTLVRTPDMRLVGWTDRTGTYDAAGRRRLPCAVPEWLLALP
jgi:hypothetical protein